MSRLIFKLFQKFNHWSFDELQYIAEKTFCKFSDIPKMLINVSIVYETDILNTYITFITNIFRVITLCKLNCFPTR